jgi:uncharacterized protein
MTEENPAADTSAQPQSAEPQLSAIEARVLGALMEKQLTTPDTYPLTLNSLVLACNQKTSREPISNYSSGDVLHCLRGLEERKLVDVDYGSRADRYAQRLTRALGVDKRVQALLNVMLLRGPQTIHELLTRSQRMHDFENDHDVEDTLNHLCEKVVPIIQRVPRQAGQREDRFVHLLSGAPDLTAIAAMSGGSKQVVAGEAEEHIKQLEQRIAELEKKVAVLMIVTGVNEADVADSGLA